MAEHVDVTDPYIHEPKGASTASSGELYVANGLGSGSWTTTYAYGGLVLNDSDGTIEINNIGTTAQKIDVFSDSMPFSGVSSDETTDNDLEVPFSGTYLINFNISAATLAVGDAGTYNYRLRINGSEPTTPNNLGVQVMYTGTTDLQSSSFSGLITISSSDNLTIWVESDEAGDTDDLAVYEANFSATLVKRS